MSKKRHPPPEYPQSFPMSGTREKKEPLPTFVRPVGVRKMRLASGDHHSDLDQELGFNCGRADQPIAALLKFTLAASGVHQ
jgi:hypothetical protein